MRLPLPVVLATGNADKAHEIIEILVGEVGAPLAGWAVTVGSDTFGYVLDRPEAIADTAARIQEPVEPPDVEETGETLEANARIKASALVTALGVPALADDTGLEVDALGGEPGVYSARYAGDGATYTENVNKLLGALGDGTERSARFATVALARWPGGREVARRGVIEGAIASDPRGTNGFGYDPVFVPAEGDGRTFAEMSPSEKHALSHRGRAFRALVHAIAEP
jgi:XTP/dITP diphosphohydrolase